MSHQLKNLVIYTTLEEDILVNQYYKLITLEDYNERQKVYYALVKGLVHYGRTFSEHVFMLMLETENQVLTRLTHSEYALSELDYACIKNDLMIVNWLLSFDMTEMIHEIDNHHGLLNFLLMDVKDSQLLDGYSIFFKLIAEKPIFHQQCDDFVDMLRRQGTGSFASNNAFYVTSQDAIVPIENYRPLRWDQIYDYEVQREMLKKNTEAFVAGRPYNHALLVGSSGTGKSSSVKAVVDLYKHNHLKLIQLYKGQLSRLPELIEQLKKTMFKYIIFMDDLSFEVNEDEYKFLKSFIEGGILNEASNVAFYVTSNRRHLIKEVRSDREGDIHLNDFIQEMTSLSDRFGLIVTFEALSQKAYFEMVKQMAKDAGLDYDDHWLEGEANKWSLRHGGMSGRVANQLIRQLQIN